MGTGGGRYLIFGHLDVWRKWPDSGKSGTKNPGQLSIEVDRIRALVLVDNIAAIVTPLARTYTQHTRTHINNITAGSDSFEGHPFSFNYLVFRKKFNWKIDFLPSQLLPAMNLVHGGVNTRFASEKCRRKNEWSLCAMSGRRAALVMSDCTEQLMMSLHKRQETRREIYKAVVACMTAMLVLDRFIS